MASGAVLLRRGRFAGRVGSLRTCALSVGCGVAQGGADGLNRRDAVAIRTCDPSLYPLPPNTRPATASSFAINPGSRFSGAVMIA